jgi:hypothetical protein
MADFTKADLQSPTWAKLQTYLESELVSLRLRNDQDQSTEVTANLRGRIAAFKQILALAEPRQGPPEPDA